MRIIYHYALQSRFLSNCTFTTEGVLMKNIPQSAAALKKIMPHGKTFCLVGGAFDLIHVGHLHLLEYAATLEVMLVVAVLSDKHVRGDKDPDRPIISQK